MTASEITELFEPWRQKHERTAWKPVLRDEPTDVLSWFGGQPTSSSGRQWPICRGCQAPMRFFLQLAAQEFPQSSVFPLKEGVIQLFVCSTDDGSCETWAPFTGTHDICVVSSHPGTAAPPSGIESFPRQFITRWDQTVDAPHPEEHETLGLKYTYDFKSNVVDVVCEHPPISLNKAKMNLDVAEAISNALPGDKLGGWPYWVQSAEYPQCPKCQSQMNLLLQIDSEDNLPYMFGDAGCAHLTFCPNHPDVFAFGWACS